MPVPRRSPGAGAGATVAEYLLLVALVAVLLASGVTLLGGSVGALGDEVADLLGAGFTVP